MTPRFEYEILDVSTIDTVQLIVATICTAILKRLEDQATHSASRWIC